MLEFVSFLKIGGDLFLFIEVEFGLQLRDVFVTRVMSTTLFIAISDIGFNGLFTPSIVGLTVI